MKLLVISHKETWHDASSPSGFSTIGGFPFQMLAISEIFDEMVVMVPIRKTPLPLGAKHLIGHNFRVFPISEPKGVDLERKLRILAWLPHHLPIIWHEMRRADAVHALVGGDIGTIGILLALLQRKPLFVRHCGTWGVPVSFADRTLLWFLERIAGGRNVVMATGGADLPPSQKNPHIQWIFSTTLSEQELASIPVARPWQSGESLRLVTVGRLSKEKNVVAIIEALPRIRQVYGDVSLDIVGEGPVLGELKRLADELNLSDRVIFNGNISHAEVVRILSISHLFVFPTFSEGFPKALLEAMACGLPSVATAVSVIPHLVGDRNGILLANTGSSAVVEAVLKMISDPQRMAQMGASACQTAQKYTLEAWGDQIGAELHKAWGMELRRTEKTPVRAMLRQEQPNEL